MLTVRDALDTRYAEPLDIATLARLVHVSPEHLIRSFKSVFAETPHRYLQRRRVERAMFWLRTTDRPVTQVCLDVGFESLGTFTRTFRAVVGETPTAYRRRGPLPPAPGCVTRAWTRPASYASVSEKPEGARVS
ncbi:AraC family transcriptional regulator [Nocardioides mangrovicus]|uniref:AraC family transcriptional regulator n=2 Tax=Nocardioides mangrovicus TaxID=2478913 RepID=A0A3L8NZN6_9ACTN|nr:AraC family transcriptional regulator [Nocardioides mangrovicus]